MHVQQVTRAVAVAIATLGTIAAFSFANQPPASSDSKLSAHVFEQRVYTTDEGKLPLLHARFRNHTNHLFVKHGMKLIGYWTPVDRENTLIYILAYPSLDARKKSWDAFMADPKWQQVWADSKEAAGGKIVTAVESTFMEPTDYSPLR